MPQKRPFEFTFNPYAKVFKPTVPNSSMTKFKKSGPMSIAELGSSRSKSGRRTSSMRTSRTGRSTMSSVADALKESIPLIVETIQREANKPRRQIHRIGNYQGKFKKLRRVKKPNLYCTKGFQGTMEVTGTTADPDVCYLGVSTMSIYETIDTILYALLRKLFTKAGAVISNLKETLQGAYASGGWDASKMILQYSYIDSTDTFQHIEYTVDAADSIYSIIGNKAKSVTGNWTAFVTAIYGIAYGTHEYDRPVFLKLFQTDNGTTPLTYNFKCELDLRNERVHIKHNVAIKIQNRTLAANDNSADADDVASNPLEGYMYLLKGGCPRVSVMNGISAVNLLDNVDTKTGVIIVRGASFATQNSSFKEPVKPQLFKGCTKYSKITLQPGAIKKGYVSWKESGSFEFLIGRIGYKTPPANSKQYKLKGNCLMFALEDMININAANNISLAYQVDRTTSAYLTTKKKIVSLGNFNQIEYNNDPV